MAIPPILDTATYRRLMLEGLAFLAGVTMDIPPILDTATFRRLSLQLLDSASGGGGVTPEEFAALDLDTLPTSDPGDGKPWLNGGVMQVGP
tara:strand:- start:11012 stop:11284 length:273 start_codon:yes stop_codon:yes gene_type:complete